MNHLTSAELQDHIDGGGREETADHLRICRECQSSLAQIRQIENALRMVPLEQPSSGLTEHVMRRLGIRQSPSFSWLLMKNLAPLLALGVTGCIIVFALQTFGIVRGESVQQSVAYSQNLYGTVGERVSSTVGALNLWLEKYASFAFARNSYYLTAFLMAFFGLIALMDKFVIAPMMRKRIRDIRSM